jgi:hypothetical protein
MGAAIALVNVTAERRSSTLDDGTHRSALLAGGPVTKLLEESFAVPPDHIGDFKPWP